MVDNVCVERNGALGNNKLGWSGLLSICGEEGPPEEKGVLLVWGPDRYNPAQKPEPVNKHGITNCVLKLFVIDTDRSPPPKSQKLKFKCFLFIMFLK